MRLAFVLALLSASPLAAAQGADHLLGLPYAGLPGGWAETAGMVLPATDSLTHALSEHWNVHDARRLFTYARLDRMVEERYPLWTILAALVVEDTRPGEEATAFGCHAADGQAVVAVVGALAADDNAGPIRYGRVRLAWALDRDAARFDPIDPTAVTCPHQERH